MRITPFYKYLAHYSIDPPLARTGNQAILQQVKALVTVKSASLWSLPISRSLPPDSYRMCYHRLLNLMLEPTQARPSVAAACVW